MSEQLSLTNPVTPGARLRLVYRISVGAIAGAAGGARNAAQLITQAWDESGVQAYRVTQASDPTQGGASGAGLWNVFSSITGRDDYYSAIDVRVDLNPSAGTYQQLLAPKMAIALGVLGLDASAQLDHIELVPTASGSGNTSAGAQDSTTRQAASSSKATAVLPTVTASLGRLLMWAAVVAAVVLVIVAMRRRS